MSRWPHDSFNCIPCGGIWWRLGYCFSVACSLVCQPMKTNQKTCKYCKQKFTPERPKAICCSPDCAYDYGLKVKSKAEAIQKQEDRKIIKLKLEKLKTARDWTKEAQIAFNGWVRLRDAEEPCISCGRHHQGQYHAGHYLSVGAHPELRFDLLNVWKQCQPCNTHLHGNLISYRKRLLEKIGIEKLEWLEGPHNPKKYTIDELKIIVKEYRIKSKLLRG